MPLQIKIKILEALTNKYDQKVFIKKYFIN